jgi:thioredoxin reductase (NADPH)
MDIRNVVIMGSGCAGHTAALYSARANLKPLVIEGHEPGGQLSMTTLVENFPGFAEGIQGPELIENMRKQATRFGADYRIGHVVKADLSKYLSKQPFELSIGKETIQTRTLIIASGASARWLGLPNEHALIGHGVSSCATCDGFFFSGKEIAVIGGGDSAMEEATFLTRFATKVLDVGKKEVTALRLRNLKSGESWEFPTSAMFLGIGHIPNARIFEGQLETDADGYLVTQKNVFTRVPGVFACGDVQDRRYRQAVTAAGSGCMAALEVEKYLEEEGH